MGLPATVLAPFDIDQPEPSPIFYFVAFVSKKRRQEQLMLTKENRCALPADCGTTQRPAVHSCR